MCLSLAPIQTQRMTMEPRQELKQLLQQLQEMRHPEFPHAAKGLEGLRISHEILQARRAVGILIGGLSHAVWNRKRTPAELALHKDTDVLVTTKDFSLEKPFEGGIDWWMPQTDRFSLLNETGGTDRNVSLAWWENANNVVLSYQVEQKRALPPGLYIPSPGWVTTMRETEAEASIDPKIGISDDALSLYTRKIANSMRKTLMPALRSVAEGFILSDQDDAVSANDAFVVKPQEWRESVAIRTKRLGLLVPSPQ